VHDWGCLTWTKIFSKTRKARMRFTGLCNHIQIAGALQPDLDRPLFCSSILSYLLPPILFSPLLFRSSAEEEEMTGFLVIALLLCLLKDGAYKATAWDDADFSKMEHTSGIRYPFRLESSNTSSLCGAPCMKLGCYGDDTILVLPTAIIQYKVTAIDYRHGTLTLAPRVDNSSSSCKQKLMSVSLPRSIIKCEDQDPCSLLQYRSGYATIVSCLREFTPSNLAANYIFGPISCLSTESQFSYLVAGYASMSVLPLDCRVVPDTYFPILPIFGNDGSTFKDQAEAILNLSWSATISWDYYRDDGGIAYNCTRCGQGGGHCGFSPDRNQTFCMNHGIISNWFDPIIYIRSPYKFWRTL